VKSKAIFQTLFSAAMKALFSVGRWMETQTQCTIRQPALIGEASSVPSGVFSVRGSGLDQHPTHFLDRWVSLATQLANNNAYDHNYFLISPAKL
jgi:hypothetical protein